MQPEFIESGDRGSFYREHLPHNSWFNLFCKSEQYEAFISHLLHILPPLSHFFFPDKILVYHLNNSC